jgi:hypothetical protein
MTAYSAFQFNSFQLNAFQITVGAGAVPSSEGGIQSMGRGGGTHFQAPDGTPSWDDPSNDIFSSQVDRNKIKLHMNNNSVILIIGMDL